MGIGFVEPIAFCAFKSHCGIKARDQTIDCSTKLTNLGICTMQLLPMPIKARRMGRRETTGSVAINKPYRGMKVSHCVPLAQSQGASESPVMSSKIEDYALLGDCETAALVARDGSIDWLCWPRFDSCACFAALLGGPEHGRWLIRPLDPNPKIRRRYLEHKLTLETDFETAEGAVALVDFMPLRGHASDVARI